MTAYRQAQTTDEAADRQGFLPDFCNVRMLFSLVVLAELLAFVLALGPQVSDGGRWQDLSLVSLFIQWVVLGNAALLCLLRSRLHRFSVAMTTALTTALVVTVTLVVSELSYLISRQTGLDSLLPGQWHGEFLLRNAAISVIITLAALRFFYLQSRLAFNIAARSQAQIDALQARIRPHFLFNSMNTIASLTRSQPALAETIVEDLADLFRVSLADQQSLSTLGEEIQLCQRYLNIEQTRLGDRLHVEWKLDDPPLNSPLPALTLQPLLENAIYHGIEPLPDGGTIVIHMAVTGQRLTIRISNPLSHQPVNRRQGHHMALNNTRARLTACFGDGAELTTEQDEQFSVTLSWPVSATADDSTEQVAYARAGM